MSNQLWKMKSEGQWWAVSDIYVMSDNGVPDTIIQFYFYLDVL